MIDFYLPAFKVRSDQELQGRISGLLNFLLAYFSFLWKKELHVAADDLSGKNDIA